MPKIYRRNCNKCGKDYKGRGKQFCSYACRPGFFKKGMSYVLGMRWKLSPERVKQMTGENSIHYIKDRTQLKKNPPTYAIYQGMKARCLNKNSPAYKYYGGRGIAVCDRWLKSFKNFYEDMGDRPKGMSLDRKDNNGNYTKENCRWATEMEQHNNMQKNVFIKGKTISQWSRILGMNYGTLHTRYKFLGWSPEETLSNKLYK